MAERINLPEQHEAHEGKSEQHEIEVKRVEKEPTKEKRQDIAEIRHKVESAALSRDEVKAKAEKSPAHHHHKQTVSRETKQVVYERTLLQVRRRLSPLSRAGSKVIHQKAVEAASEAVGKTVARPSGLLGGGLVAFVGTAAYYYMTWHYGYDYRSSVFLALLIGGFIVGWILEAFFRIFKRSR